MSLRTSGPPAEGRCGAGSRRQVVGTGQIPRAQNTGSGSARSRNDGVQARDRARSFDQERRRDLRSDAGRFADDWAVSADRTYRVRCRDIAEHLAVGSAARISFPPHEHASAKNSAVVRKRRHNYAAGPGASAGSVTPGSCSGRPARTKSNWRVRLTTVATAAKQAASTSAVRAPRPPALTLKTRATIAAPIDCPSSRALP